MLSNNPFLILSETISPLAMQSFIIAMVLMIAIGTIIQMIHHKNLTYFFNNAKKAKLSATKKLGVGEKVSVIAKTTVVDIGTTSELHMFLECMEQFCSGFPQLFWFSATQVLINQILKYGQCFGILEQF